MDACGEPVREDGQQHAPENGQGYAEGRMEPVREDVQSGSQQVAGVRAGARHAAQPPALTLRRFALDRITKPELCAEASIDIAEDELDAVQ